MANQSNLDPHKFKKGKSGNPAGRPKGSSITTRLRKLVEDNEGEIENALAKAAVKAALKGDHRFWNAIVDRLEGKVADRVHLSGNDGGPIQINIIRGVDPREKDGDGD